MKMQVNLWIVMVAVYLVQTGQAKTKRYSKIQSNTLHRIRCDLMCYERSKETKQMCKSQCRMKEKKPGTCPSSDTPKWEEACTKAACVEACNSDSQCHGVQKCCHHGYGSTCSEPIDLLTVPGLPALPLIEEPKEKRRAVVISWSDGVGDAARAVPGPVSYVLEEQHHLGPKYEEMRLEDWNLLMRTNKTKVSLRNTLKPGRWYRFRVAAVSASGTRGFSLPSPAFTPRRGPKSPPPPKNLKARTLRVENGTVTARLEWKEPNSDLPVMRYKVYWSRRVKGLGGELDSVLVNHQRVPKEQHHIDISGLLPNSKYFLQVQTISQFGTSKLRSERESIFFNTTSIEKYDSPPEQLMRRDKKIKGLKLHKIVWYNHKLKARISWEPVPNIYEWSGRYYVNWNTIKCQNTKNQRQQGLSASTQRTSFDLYELGYQCSYKVNVNTSPRAKISDSELFISVPPCDYFKRRINNTIVNCDN